MRAPYRDDDFAISDVSDDEPPPIPPRSDESESDEGSIDIPRAIVEDMPQDLALDSFDDDNEWDS